MKDFKRPAYLNWLIKEDGVVFEDGIGLQCYRIDYDITDDSVLNEWAVHIRKHYITDADLNEAKEDLELDDINEYLKENIIPQKSDKLGPTTISGEIAEILIYDLFEFILNYIAFRGRHWNKPSPTSPIQGTDVIVAKVKDVNKPSREDELCMIEVKASFSDDDYSVIKKAKEHSEKDTFRIGASLDYLRKKYSHYGENELKELVVRFQKKAKYSYREKYVGASVISRKNIEKNTVLGLNGKDLEIKTDDRIFLIHGEKLMDLAYEVYRRITK